MIKYLVVFILLLFSNNINGQVDTNCLKILSWNIQNLGKSKLEFSETLEFITSIIKDYDVVAIQEVSTSEFGIKVISELDNKLDKTGCLWDFVISDPTSGEGSERFVYMFKKHRVKILKFSLEKELENLLNREPFKLNLLFNNKEYYFYNFHLVPKEKKPENEIFHLKKINMDGNVIMMGDFNLSQSHNSFSYIKKKMNPSLIGKKTSLKLKEENEWLNMEYDNFFVSNRIKIIQSDVIHFYKKFTSLKSARKISDHCPIYLYIKG